MNKAPIKKEINVSAPNGYKEVKCSQCSAEWYVPSETVVENPAFVCPECLQTQANSIDSTKAAAEAAIKG